MNLKTCKVAIATVLMLVMALWVPVMALAAAPEFTALQKHEFEKTAAGADSQLAERLTGQYRDYLSLAEQSRSWEQQTGALHYRNEDRSADVRKRIMQINSAKINTLKLSVENAKKRYQPLFDLYTSVNKQLTAARKLKNKTLTSVLSAQAESLKLSVEAARADIKGKQLALASARDAANAWMKKVRTTLSGIDPLKKQYKALKESVSVLQDNRSLTWKTLTQAVKKRDAKAASERFAAVNGLTVQLLGKLQQMHGLEVRIADIIAQAEAQLKQAG
ncbi:hypothetical protein E5161_16370 [Cohnella pontilimi]|uniref:Uncharacterized protein n=1 Tax=Cohnella pontilimi TaxID=2564100 RepID=A0A4U0F7Y9_9BACL|nr:hypothetical protein [Cohnella pontilimi]TJY40721.1 hypothetical protein E5161_16370 [Cohnella pontilimi]